AAISPMRRISPMTRLRSSSWLRTMWSWGWVVMVVGRDSGFGIGDSEERASRPGRDPLCRIPNPESRIPRRGSPEPPRDVILRLLLRRIREDHVRRAVFDQVAQVHEGGEVGHARGLLHVVGDDGDGVVDLQLLDQLFDAA